MRTDRPLVFIKVYPEATKGNKALGEALDVSERLLTFKYEDETDKADRCDLVLDNHDMSQFDNPAWRKGAFIDVAWGYPGNMTATRRVVIQKMKGGSELRVEAHGLAMLMHKKKLRRTWKKKTLYDIVTDVVMGYEGELGEQDVLTRGISQDAKKLTLNAHQASETDAMFLNRLARKYGYSFFLDQTGFHFHPRDTTHKLAPTKVLTWFNGAGEWLDFDYETDVTEKHSRIGAGHVDPHAVAAKKAEASNDKTKREGLATNVTWNGIRGTFEATAASVKGLSAKIDSLPASPEKDLATSVRDSLVQTGKQLAEVRSRAEEVDHGPFSGGDSTAAKMHVDAKYKRRKQKEHQLSGRCIGDPSFFAKTVMMAEGIGRRLSGRWAVKKVGTTIDSSGFINDFKAEREGDNGYGQPGDVNSKANINTKPPVKKNEDLPNHNWDYRSGTVAGAATLDKKPFFAPDQVKK